MVASIRDIEVSRGIHAEAMRSEQICRSRGSGIAGLRWIGPRDNLEWARSLALGKRGRYGKQESQYQLKTLNSHIGESNRLPHLVGVKQ